MERVSKEEIKINYLVCRWHEMKEGSILQKKGKIDVEMISRLLVMSLN